MPDLLHKIEGMDLPCDYFEAQFTLGELQSGYEQQLGYALDKSSFRRKLDARSSVRAVDGAFRRGANRPAQLYAKG